MTAPAATPGIETGPVGRLFARPDIKAMITPLLRGDSYEAVVSEIHILVRRKPDILKCTGESIVMAVADGLRWGLIFGETVHMVPFNEKVKYLDEQGRQQERKEWRAHAIIGWKGAIEMIIRSGSARDIDAQCVYENELDTFVVRQGSDPDIQHNQIWDEKKRGKLVAAYCIAYITQYRRKVVVMSVAEIDAIRKEFSKQHKDGPLTPWYARKTLVLQMGNRLPRNIKLDKMLGALTAEDRIALAEDVEAVVTQAPAVPTRLALGEGDAPMQMIDTNKLRQGVPVGVSFSDDELDAQRFAELDENGNFIPPY